MFDFRDRVVIITGASGAIGGALSQLCVAQGAFVALLGSSLESVEKTVGELRLPHHRIWTGAADLSSREEVAAVSAAVLKHHGRIDVVVHGAAAYCASPVEETTEEELDHVLAVNLRAPFTLTKAFLPALKKSQGQVAFLNSSVGKKARGGLSAYGASKHALVALADSLRDEVNPIGIRVLSVFIGRTASAMQERVHAIERRPYRPELLLQPGDVARSVVSALQLGRSGEVTDIHVRPVRKLDSGGMRP